MKNRHLFRSGILATAISLAGCFGSRDVVETRFYTPTPPALSPVPEHTLPQPLVVADFRVDSHLSGDRLAAHISPQQIEYYAQHRWAGPLDRLLTEQARGALRDYFTNVSAEASGSDQELVLSASVSAFEEVDEGDHWYGHAAIDFTLRDSFTGETIWKGFLESKKPASTRHPSAVVAALGEALGEILAQAAASWGKILSEPMSDG